jgi:hypothetical protein
MDSIEELLLIPGVTESLFFGEPADEAGDDEELAESIAPLAELLTVHGHPEGRVNVNTATREVLEALLAADPRGGNPGMADQILQRISEAGPYLNRAELRSEGILTPPPPPGDQRPGQDQDGGPEQVTGPELFDVRSSVFRILGDSSAGDSSVRVEAYVWRDTPNEDEEGGLTASGAAQMFRVIDWRVTS